MEGLRKLEIIRSHRILIKRGEDFISPCSDVKPYLQEVHTRTENAVWKEVCVMRQLVSRLN